MSNFDPENIPDGDWEDRGELSWNEADWQRFLRQQEQEVEQFRSAYRDLKDQPDRLDAAARRLGWDAGDWSMAEDASDDEDEDDEDGPEEVFDDGPYTIHRHPVFIVTRALYRDLRLGWEEYAARNTVNLPGRAAWDYAQALSAGEREALLGVSALDFGDVTLAVVHFKHGLSALNLAFKVLDGLPRDRALPGQVFQAETRRRLFDLREVWLRVMADCRAEARRGLADED